MAGSGAGAALEEFDLIILRAQFYPPPVLGAIWFRYQPVTRVCMNGFEYTLLLPSRRLGPGNEIR